MTEVQTVREGLGNTNAQTAVLRPVQVAEPTMQMQVADPTMVVAPVPFRQPDDRPSWARLPEPKDRAQPRRRAAAPAGPGAGKSFIQWLTTDRRGRQTMVAVAVVLALLVLVSGWWIGFGRYTEAPRLVSMTRAEAEAEAARQGFTIAYAEPRYDENVAKDVVLGQEPAANARIVKGGTITLTLSLGPERYQVPDVVGKTYDLAVADLEKVKARVEQTEGFHDNLPTGVVISVDPEPGTEIKPGDVVTITVSKGRAPITVPNLLNKDIEEARAILRELGLVPRETYVEDNRPRGLVIRQDPPDGAGVEKGAEIELDVSMGPPLVTVPLVRDMPCQQAQQVLQSHQLNVHVLGDPNGVVHVQNPGENTQVNPGTVVVIRCRN